VSDLERQLREALQHWRESMRRVGEICLQLIQSGEFAEGQLMHLCKHEYGMSQSSFTVSIRWARGDFGNAGETVVKKIPASKLAQMPTEVVKKLATGTHRIVSPTEHRPVQKRLVDMTKEEVSHCVKNIGVPSVSEQIRRIPEIRSCIATKVDDDPKGVVFISKGSCPIHMKVSHKMLMEAMEIIGAESATA
jgi:hypothetical protein